MLYCSVLDISRFSDNNVQVMREKIKGHFIGKSNLDKKESVIAKGLLCHILCVKFGLSDFTIDCDKNGKPFIVESDLEFNLSHSGDFVLCLCGDEKVGCDIQKKESCNMKVAKRFFTVKECDILEKSSQKELDFTILWTLKESALKFSGQGITGGLDRYDFSEYYNKDGFTYEGMFFNRMVIPGYVISVCSESGNLIQYNADLKDMTDLVC